MWKFFISVASEMNVHIIRISYPMITRYNEKRNFLFYEVSENEKKVFARIVINICISSFESRCIFHYFYNCFVSKVDISDISRIRSFERIKRQ